MGIDYSDSGLRSMDVLRACSMDCGLHRYREFQRHIRALVDFSRLAQSPISADAAGTCGALLEAAGAAAWGEDKAAERMASMKLNDYAREVVNSLCGGMFDGYAPRGRISHPLPVSYLRGMVFKDVREGVGYWLDDEANDVLRDVNAAAAYLESVGKYPEGRATVGEVMEAAGRELMGAMERIRLEGDGPVGMERDTATVLLNSMYSRTVAAATAMQGED